jgi:hypothetical protein
VGANRLGALVLSKAKDLDKALAEITAIRSQMAKGAEFRGYGPMTLAATGLLAMLGATFQAYFIPDPARNIEAFVAIWLAVAVVSFALIGLETAVRSRRIHSGLADEMLYAAIGEFVPAGVAGLLTTFILFRFAPQSLWMLPGLWQIIFSLGVFASCHLLPRPIFAAGAWYFLCGLMNLALAQEERAFSPLSMGVPFGVGQLLIAFILHRSFGDSDGA